MMSQEFKKAAHIMRKVKSECTYLRLFCSVLHVKHISLLEPDFDNSTLMKQEGNRAEMRTTIILLILGSLPEMPTSAN